MSASPLNACNTLGITLFQIQGSTTSYKEDLKWQMHFKCPRHLGLICTLPPSTLNHSVLPHFMGFQLFSPHTVWRQGDPAPGVARLPG